MNIFHISESLRYDGTVRVVFPVRLGVRYQHRSFTILPIDAAATWARAKKRGSSKEETMRSG